MLTAENFTCPICYKNKSRRMWKCSDCIEGGICYECVVHYCPSGFSFTDDINEVHHEVKCPICRATQFKWIFDELIQTFLHDIDGYEAETPLELIVRTNMYL